MRFGFCTNFASPFTGDIDYGLLERISAAGFDEVELPLCQVQWLEQSAFLTLSSVLIDLHLASTVCTNFFPDTMPLTGEMADLHAIQEYLGRALDRGARLGVRKIVFASVADWQIPANGSREKGYDRLTNLLECVLIPRCRPYGMKILVEPLRKTVCSLLNTVSDGIELARRVNSPWVQLAIDSYHILNNAEDPLQIEEAAPVIDHVHVVELLRALPVEGYSPGLQQILHQLRAVRYDCSLSFESVEGGDVIKMKKALALLREWFR